MVKEKIENETNRARFKRLAKIRTQKVLKKLEILGHCSNPTLYEYDEKEVKLIFSAIDRELKRLRSMFSKPSKNAFDFE
jgi:uncharacterized membrane-anchored protein